MSFEWQEFVKLRKSGHIYTYLKKAAYYGVCQLQTKFLCYQRCPMYSHTVVLFFLIIKTLRNWDQKGSMTLDSLKVDLFMTPFNKKYLINCLCFGLWIWALVSSGNNCKFLSPKNYKNCMIPFNQTFYVPPPFNIKSFLNSARQLLILALKFRVI